MSSEPTGPTLRVDDVVVERVEEPSSVEELQSILAQIEADDLHAVVVGGGTRLPYGNVGGPFDLAVSTRRLTRILNYEPDNLTIAVEPGCTLSQIHDTISQHQQSMALDAARSDRSTIGGAYATGLAGPRRLSGGSLKDWVIGLEVAGPGGVIAKAGGMVVKNVTGYDMMHVHYGALGAFGIVTRLNLKVFPTPSASHALRFVFVSAKDAHAAGVRLLESQLQPGAILVSNLEGWALTVRLDAPINAIERLTDRVVRVVQGTAARSDHEVLPDAADATVPFTQVVDLDAGRCVARLPVVASGQAAKLELLGSGDTLVCGDLGSGLVYISCPDDDKAVARVDGMESNATWLSLPPHLKHGRDVFGSMIAPVQGVVRNLKKSFDPDDRFNRGRFVLGL